jgi:flavin-dependent dehydrogenase
MAVRATKRGTERTALSADVDVVICGASFAGLAAARELVGSGATVLVVDRYEIGERQTSACAIPTDWLYALGLEGTIKQTFTELVIKRPRGGSGPATTRRWAVPWSFSTFDYRQLCAELAAQGDFRFETAKVDGITRGAVHTVHTDRGDLRAPLVVDALGWRRVLSAATDPIQPPDAFLSRGLEVHPAGNSPDLELWLDPNYVRSGYSWIFPAGDELRVGVGSFDPNIKVKDPTVRLAHALDLPTDGYQGNWIPHRLREATGGGVFFVGDSAGHCLPTTAEGIRPALYFGLAVGREMRAVHEGQRTRDEALARYSAFHERHRRAYELFWYVQRSIGPLNGGRGMDAMIKAFSSQRSIDFCFRRYLEIAPPSFVHDRGAGAISRPSTYARRPRSHQAAASDHPTEQPSPAAPVA